MGYNADQTRSTGVFFLSTSGSSPYCGMYIIEQLVLDRYLFLHNKIKCNKTWKQKIVLMFYLLASFVSIINCPII